MDKAALRPEDRDRPIFEFDGFRVDPVRRVLSRDGRLVAITPKAFSILLALLERPGEVVEKKELIEKVWPGTFVSEANLTQNVFSLRKTLGERANDGRWVATVPGCGYSFAGEVRRLERCATSEIPLMDPPPPDGENGSAVLVPQDQAPPEVGGAEAREELPGAGSLDAAVPPRRASRALWWALLAVVAIGAGLFGLLLGARELWDSAGGGSSPVRPAIAVLDVKSLAPRDGSRWLETAFAEMLTTELAAGGDLRVIRRETVAQTWRPSASRRSAEPGRSELRRLHDALGVDFVVIGSYIPLAGKIRLNLRVLEAPHGDTVISLAEVGTQPGLFELVSRSGARLRESLGAAALSARQIEEARALRPASARASRLYAEGLARLRAFEPPGALEFLEQAAEAEPESPVIHSALSQAWASQGYDARAQQEARKALELAGSLPRAERLAIEAHLHKTSKQWNRASVVYRSLWTFYPDDVEYGLQLVDSLINAGRGAEAAAAIAGLRELPPPAGLDPRIDLAEVRNAWRLSDLATAMRAAATAAAKGRRSGQTLVVSRALIYQGSALLSTGRPREAIALFKEAAKLAEDAGYRWGVGMAMANLALGLQSLGDLDGAQKADEQALEIAESTGSAIGIAAQLHMLGTLRRDRGELAAALELLDRSRAWNVKLGDRLMEARVLNDTAAVLLAQGELARAQDGLERALELSQALGTRADEARTLTNLGTLLAVQGEVEEARLRHAEAAAILSQVDDSGLAASALAANAENEAKLGDPAAAWQRSSQALAMKRQSGDVIGVGRILGSQARIAYQLGDLAASRTLANEQLAIARKTGARPLAARALQHLGRAGLAAGRLAAARESLAEALEVSSELREDLLAMEVRLDLAAVMLAAGRPGEAVRNAREAAAWFRDRGIPGKAAQASALLAEALARQGLLDAASQPAAAAGARLNELQDRELRITTAVSLARFEMLRGNPQAALRLLRHAVADVASSGLTAAGLEARLAFAEVQRALGDPAADDIVAAVAKEAAERGFHRLAASALETPPEIAGIRAPGL